MKDRSMETRSEGWEENKIGNGKREEKNKTAGISK
jgi:hypothetical protein